MIRAFWIVTYQSRLAENAPMTHNLLLAGMHPVDWCCLFPERAPEASAQGMTICLMWFAEIDEATFTRSVATTFMPAEDYRRTRGRLHVSTTEL